ncbi:MAG: hypothetical protein CVT94_16335 [Bacteroidetes bacterium HGW-Bacteroidetes-11]|nr:MAG: hypothetical protein CVT94_16335 [Bacteroidetes bacterium HGW-Bacteroidetes-11]
MKFIISNNVSVKLTKTFPRTVSSPASNSTNKKLAVQWLNEDLCFVSSSVLVDSLVLRNPPES